MLVSAIMPTSDRRRFVPQAIECFLAQTWPEKELIIVDDGEDSIGDLVPENPAIFYAGLDKLSIGQKRNQCCEFARGQVIVHWDDDDWSAPSRIEDQVNRLMESGLSVTGYHSLLFHSLASGALYRFDAKPQRYALGTSLCYLKSWWAEHRFQDLGVGEDNAFITPAIRGHKQLITADGGEMMVARVHDRHTSPKNLRHPEYRQVQQQFPAGYRV